MVSVRISFNLIFCYDLSKWKAELTAHGPATSHLSFNPIGVTHCTDGPPNAPKNGSTHAHIEATSRGAICCAVVAVFAILTITTELLALRRSGIPQETEFLQCTLELKGPCVVGRPEPAGAQSSAGSHIEAYFPGWR